MAKVFTFIVILTTYSTACRLTGNFEKSNLNFSRGTQRLVVESNTSDINSTIMALRMIQGIKIIARSLDQPKISVESQLPAATLARAIKDITNLDVNVYVDEMSSVDSTNSTSAGGPELQSEPEFSTSDPFLEDNGIADSIDVPVYFGEWSSQDSTSEIEQ